MISMACPLLSATYLNSCTGRHCLTPAFCFCPPRVVRVASFANKKDQPSVAVLNVKRALEVSATTRADSQTSGNSSPASVSSDHSLNFLSILSSWNVWLSWAAVLLSVTIYRRMSEVEAAMEKAGKTREIVKGLVDEKMSDEESMISELSFKMGGIAQKINDNAQKAREVLEKVEHVKMEVEQLVRQEEEEEEEEEEERRKPGEGNQ